MLGLKLNYNELTKINADTASVYSPINYIPQSLGIFVARLFTNRPMIMLYMARLFNMIVSLILLYLAIKIMPFGKKLCC